jgi:hypothetical protein
VYLVAAGTPTGIVNQSLLFHEGCMAIRDIAMEIYWVILAMIQLTIRVAI